MRTLSLRQRLGLAFGLVILVVFGIGGGTAYWLMEDRLVTQSRQHLEATTRSIHAMTRGLILNAIKNYLKGVSETHLAHVEFLHERQADGELSVEAARQRAADFMLSQKVGESGYVTAVDITDSPDSITLAVHPQKQGADISKFDFVQRMARQRNGYMEFMWQNPGDPEPRLKAEWMSYFEPWEWIINAAPYREEYPRLVDLSGVRQELSGIQVGDTGELLLLGHDGEVLMHPRWKGRNADSIRDARDGSAFLRTVMDGAAPKEIGGAASRATGAAGWLRYHARDPGTGETVEKLMSYRAIPETGWVLGVTMSTSEIRWPLIVVRDVLLGVAAVALALVALVVWWVTRPLLSRMDTLREAAHAMEAGHLDAPLPPVRQDELGVLTSAMGSMASRLEAYTQDLESQVTERTRELADAKQQAEDALARMEETQVELVEAEKMASLGSLVAGIAHEINTPVGVAVTGASHLKRETDRLKEAYDGRALTATMMEEYIEEAAEASRLLLSNSNRAAELIQSFKQVAVDQSSGERRSIDLKDYVEEVITSLRPQFKHTRHQVVVEGPDDLTVNTYPGSLSQILTNLVANALTHGFTDSEAGTMRVTLSEAGADRVRLVFADDGKGIPESIRKQVFDPFFTTRRGEGGSGLGLNIVHNIVYKSLGGAIQVTASDAGGAAFEIIMPRTVTDGPEGGAADERR